MLNLAHLQFRLSGGSANADPDLSLGGDISSERLVTQLLTALSNVTGVVVDNAVDNALGSGSLKFHATAVAQIQDLVISEALVTDNTISVDVDGVTVSVPFNTDSNTTLADFAAAIQAEPGVGTATVTDAGAGTDDDREIVITAAVAGTPVVLENAVVTGGASQATVTITLDTGNAQVDSLEWLPSGVSASNAVDVSVDGQYHVPAEGGGSLFVTVTSASLPGADQTDVVTVSDKGENLYDDIAKLESLNGDVEYRCLYLKNDHPTDLIGVVKLWISAQPTGPETLEIGLDPAGLNGTPATIADEGTAPTGVTFSAPSSEGTGLDVGDLAAGDFYPFWVKRTIAAGNQTTQLGSKFFLGFSGVL